MPLSTCARAIFPGAVHAASRSKMSVRYELPSLRREVQDVISCLLVGMRFPGRTLIVGPVTLLLMWQSPGLQKLTSHSLRHLCLTKASNVLATSCSHGLISVILSINNGLMWHSSVCPDGPDPFGLYYRQKTGELTQPWDKIVKVYAIYLCKRRWSLIFFSKGMAKVALTTSSLHTMGLRPCRFCCDR